jgi:hypothetical protein
MESSLFVIPGYEEYSDLISVPATFCQKIWGASMNAVSHHDDVHH